MKVVALISGGKDSFYSLCKCIAYGHEVVALANLFPEDSTVQDADSYMYQTVGHEIVQAYARALLLPVFRRPTKGKAVLTTLGYSRQPYDEVEDLYQLLLQVKQEMPQVEAVCTGAILSDYQRNRVEHVCCRLQLTSIAYLWKRNQKQLLQEMLQAGIDAIVVKVATMGLYPRKHLGKHLIELAPLLIELESNYGSHVCGEGGEFESLVLDCPLFYYRLVVDEAETIVVSDDRFAPIGYLRIKKYHLEEKSLHVNRMHWIKTLVPIKSMPAQTKQRETGRKKVSQNDISLMYLCKSRWCTSKTSNISYFLCCSRAASTTEDKKNVSEEMKNILDDLEQSLKECSLTRKDIFYCQLYLSDMSDFVSVNKVYASYFGTEEPPARACVEVSLCYHQLVVLEAFARKGPRKVLHVQSISEWAPPCIGPYSQAHCFQHVVYISGILALHPPTVTIVPGLNIEQETMLCIENVNHTMEALPCGWEDILFIYCYITQPQDAQRVATLLYNTYGKQFGLCIVPVRNLPRNGCVELQLICVSSNDSTGNSSQYDARPICSKQVVQGEFPMLVADDNKNICSLSEDNFQVKWQMCISGSIIVLHATWKQVPLLDSFKKQIKAIFHQWISLCEKRLDRVGAHVAWNPIVCKSWLPKDLFYENNNYSLQEITEEILVKVLSNEHSMNRTPVFIIPLEEDEQVRTCHLQLILQLDEKVNTSRL
ncbi:Diphthine--ammonia ligase [Galdieria sulphuraria]|uniref:Diphthine--ammonia ligase n=1 Tax=Galdieria sulphuraria TaxID=130081 RepID=M2XRV2_GALSU|nr:endoribonuclease [Galdieria sulphuraria]EME26378.1 endoribonuclease [Galdieria sulphuraria]GJD11679.1 Diphthine--ammonia ligase [Galdieria sulphuraria]|eukprot:XP_005702898.1 endoribonuclease [Galdieria sulphuraria]